MYSQIMRFGLLAVLWMPMTSSALDFKGVELGASVAPKFIEERTGVKCGKGANKLIVCNGNITITGAPAYMNLVIGASGTVMRIDISFDSGYYAQVSSALLDKFGNPTGRQVSVLQNRMGASFDQEVINWVEGGSEAKLKRYAGKVSESSLYMSTQEDRDFWKERMNKDKSDI
jgi:hypothetical protein